VADAMQSRGCVAGGEGNGGIIWPEVGMVRDSLAGMALMLERIAITARPVSASVAETPAYAIVKDKLPRGETPLESLAERIASSFDADRVDTQDGVRLDWADRWIHVRPSNTEPIVRVIAEAPEAVDAEKLVATARGALGG